MNGAVIVWVKLQRLYLTTKVINIVSVSQNCNYRISHTHTRTSIFHLNFQVYNYYHTVYLSSISTALTCIQYTPIPSLSNNTLMRVMGLYLTKQCSSMHLSPCGVLNTWSQFTEFCGFASIASQSFRCTDYCLSL